METRKQKTFVNLTTLCLHMLISALFASFILSTALSAEEKIINGMKFIEKDGTWYLESKGQPYERNLHPRCNTGSEEPMMAILPPLHAALADESHSNRMMWGFAGAGVGPEAAAGCAGITLFHTPHLFTGRGAISYAPLGDILWDIGVLYGRGLERRNFLLSASAGLGIAGGSLDRGLFLPQEAMGSIPSIPLQIDVSWHPSRIIGMALTGFADLNRKKSFGGLALSFHLGRLGP